jgi:aspartyl protease family protein
MTIAAWALALGLLTWLFAGFLERRDNPNLDAVGSLTQEGARELVLRRNPSGHYIAKGRINGHPVSFLVDTGATDVAVPEGLARRIGLELGRPGISRTEIGRAHV